MNRDAERDLILNWHDGQQQHKAAVDLVWSRRQTGDPMEIIYMTAYLFTEDAGLWEYARRRLEEIRGN